MVQGPNPTSPIPPSFVLDLQQANVTCTHLLTASCSQMAPKYSTGTYGGYHQQHALVVVPWPSSNVPNYSTCTGGGDLPAMFPTTLHALVVVTFQQCSQLLYMHWWWSPCVTCTGGIFSSMFCRIYWLQRL